MKHFGLGVLVGLVLFVLAVFRRVLLASTIVGLFRLMDKDMYQREYEKARAAQKLAGEIEAAFEGVVVIGYAEDWRVRFYDDDTGEYYTVSSLDEAKQKGQEWRDACENPIIYGTAEGQIDDVYLWRKAA